MTVVTELQRSAANIDGLKETLEKRLQSDLGVKVAVKLVEEGTLAEAANLGAKANRSGFWTALTDRAADLTDCRPQPIEQPPAGVGQ
jgi:hypothetical protein